MTGAISDYDADHDAGHDMQKIVLSNGSFDLGAGQFNKNFKINTDEATCAGDSTSHATNMPISHHRRVRRDRWPGLNQGHVR